MNYNHSVTKIFLLLQNLKANMYTKFQEKNSNHSLYKKNHLKNTKLITNKQSISELMFFGTLF